MENRKRNIQMKFYVTEEEKRLIDEKMKQLPIKQYGACKTRSRRICHRLLRLSVSKPHKYRRTQELEKPENRGQARILSSSVPCRPIHDLPLSQRG